MTKLRLTILACSFSVTVLSQNCYPDSLYADSAWGIWPDTISGIPCSIPGEYYETVIQFVPPTEFAEIDTVSYPPGVFIEKIYLDNVGGLPAGMSYSSDKSGSSRSEEHTSELQSH